MNTEKLQKMQAQVRIGGKGTPRRKMKKAHKAGGADDKALQSEMKKLKFQPIPMCEEVNMFKEDGRVIHITQPKVQASLSSNAFSISGNASEKDLTELIPGILPQMGADSLAQLQKFAQQLQLNGGLPGMSGAAGAEGDDDVPDLVENFEAEADKE